MAVQSDTSSISYTGNNSTSTSYSVPFVFQENSHLAATAKVTATGVESAVTLTNHTGAGDPNGGTVRTAVAVPATSTLTIYRTVPATQTTTYQEGGDFPAASHERALDKLTMLGQQNARRSDRSIRVTEADGSRNDMVAVANSVLGMDDNKQPKAMTLSEVRSFLSLTGTTLSVPAGMKTFANSGERALAVPDFTGQLGTQRDTGVLYVSNGTTAGAWTIMTPNFGALNVVTTGSIGAGTTSPSHKIHAQHTTYAAVAAIASAADSSSAFIVQNDAREWRVQCQGSDADKLYFYDATAVATRIAIDASGNVGIGTTTPASRLHVNGDITVANATTATAATAGTNGDVPAQVAGYLVVSVNGTARKIPYYAT